MQFIFFFLLTDKKVGKAVQGTTKPLPKLTKKKLKLEEDPDSGNQTAGGASTEAENNLRILKGINLYKPCECLDLLLYCMTMVVPDGISL